MRFDLEYHPLDSDVIILPGVPVETYIIRRFMHEFAGRVDVLAIVVPESAIETSATVSRT